MQKLKYSLLICLYLLLQLPGQSSLWAQSNRRGNDNNNLLFRNINPFDSILQHAVKRKLQPADTTGLYQRFNQLQSASCNTSTFYIRLSSAGTKIDLKEIQTLPNGNFILAGNTVLANNESEGFIYIMSNDASVVQQKKIRINNLPVTIWDMKVWLDGKITLAGILHDVTDKAFLCMLNNDLTLQWVQQVNWSSTPVKVKLNLYEDAYSSLNSRIILGVQSSASILYAVTEPNGNFRWLQQVSPVGMIDMAGISTGVWGEIALLSNCIRSGKYTAELLRIKMSDGTLLGVYTAGDGTEEYKFTELNGFNGRSLQAGVVKNASGQFKIVRDIVAYPDMMETEHSYSLPGTVDFNTVCATDNAADAIGISKPAEGKLVFIRHFSNYQTAIEHTREYTVPVNSAIASVSRSLLDGGFIFGLNTSAQNEIILIKTDSIGILAGCNYNTLVNNYTEVLGKNNTIYNESVTAPSVSNTAISANITSVTISKTTDCNQTYCPPAPVADTCLSTFYKIYRSNSYADIFGAYYLFSNNRHLALTYRYDRLLGAENQVTPGLKLFTENGDFIKGVSLLTDSATVLLMVKQTDDQHVMAAFQTVQNQTERYITFSLFDDNLQLQWSKTVKMFDNYNFYSGGTVIGDIVKDEQGSYYIVANTLGFTDPLRVLVYKLDANGNEVWLKVFESNQGLLLSPAAVLTNTSLILIIEGGGNQGTLSMQLDKTTGALLNNTWYNNYSSGAGYRRMLRFYHDRIFYAGNNSQSNLTIALFDSTGKPLKLRHLNHDGSLMRSATTKDSSLFVMYKYYTGTGFADVLLKTDSALNIRFINQYNDQNYGFPNGMAVSDQGNIYAAGNFFSGSFTNYIDPYIKKYDPEGMIGTCLVTHPAVIVTDSVIRLTPANFSPIVRNFTPVNTIPVAVIPDTNGQRISTLLCSSSPLCNSVDVTGPDRVCSLTQLYSYIASRNPGCTIQPVFLYDTAFISLQNSTDSSITVRFKRTGTTWIKARLNTGCNFYTDSLQVQINSSPLNYSLGNDTLLCPGDSIRLQAGSDFSTYQWQDGSTDSVFMVRDSGLYYVQVSNVCNEYFRDTIHISLAAVPLLSIGNDTSICRTDTLFLQASAGFASYNWQAASLISGQGQHVYTIPNRDDTIRIMASTTPGCRAYDSLQVSSILARPVQLGNDTSFCASDSLRLSAGSGYLQYSWSNGSSASSITVQQAGTYWVSATDVNGCKARDSLKVLQVFALPSFSLGADFNICTNSPKQLDPGPFNSYLWQDGSANRYFNANATGLYWVQVSNNNNCIARDSVQLLQILPLPSYFLKRTDTFCQYEKLQITPLVDFRDYLWSTGATQSSIAVDRPGSYYLTVTDYNGCKGTDSIQAVVKYCYTGVAIPNAFTPNGDHINDIFRARIFGQVLYFRLEIYNRFGQQVYVSNDPLAGWDGNIRGTPQQTGMFAWKCSYQLAGSPMETQTGTLMLIRYE